MTLEAEMRPRRNEQVLARQAESELILLSIANGRYYTLDEVGGRVWSMCDGTHTLDQVSSRIAEEYEAPLAEITADVRELVAELLREQLIGESV